MNSLTKNIIRFFVFVVLQALIFNQLEIGYGFHLMIHPLFVMLLPFEMGVISLLGLAFLLGIIIDVFSNTYGLHASSLVMMAYFRPMLFKFYGPREGYDPLKEPNVFDMGNRWFTLVFGFLLLIHNFWFFLVESFQLNQFLFILQKTIFSTVPSFLICLLLQSFLIKKSKTK
jgi:hypothetical protein